MINQYVGDNHHNMRESMPKVKSLQIDIHKDLLCDVTPAAILLEWNTDVRTYDDIALILNYRHYHVNGIEKLLGWSVNICCNEESILKYMRLVFNEEFVNAMLLYCAADNYHYFFCEYIKRKIVSIEDATIYKFFECTNERDLASVGT